MSEALLSPLHQFFSIVGTGFGMAVSRPRTSLLGVDCGTVCVMKTQSNFQWCPCVTDNITAVVVPNPGEVTAIIILENYHLTATLEAPHMFE